MIAMEMTTVTVDYSVDHYGVPSPRWWKPVPLYKSQRIIDKDAVVFLCTPAGVQRNWVLRKFYRCEDFDFEGEHLYTYKHCSSPELCIIRPVRPSPYLTMRVIDRAVVLFDDEFDEVYREPLVSGIRVGHIIKRAKETYLAADAVSLTTKLIVGDACGNRVNPLQVLRIGPDRHARARVRRAPQAEAGQMSIRSYFRSYQ